MPAEFRERINVHPWMLIEKKWSCRLVTPFVILRICRFLWRKTTAISWIAHWKPWRNRKPVWAFCMFPSSSTTTTIIITPSLLPILLMRRFADPTQAGTFLYQASLHGMTGTGWTYLGTDWNTMQTFAGLSLTYQQTVKDAMEGMVGISPYIGNVAALEREFEVRHLHDDLWWFMLICDDLWWFMLIYDDLPRVQSWNRITWNVILNCKTVPNRFADRELRLNALNSPSTPFSSTMLSLQLHEVFNPSLSSAPTRPSGMLTHGMEDHGNDV